MNGDVPQARQCHHRDSKFRLFLDYSVATAQSIRNADRCLFTFPTPGRWGRNHATASGNTARDFDLGDAATPLRSGAWWTLRMQILPDGRCGIAINNTVLWLSPEPIRLTGEFRVRLGDESADTKILHGPLQVWTGVRTDIDWSRKP